MRSGSGRKLRRCFGIEIARNLGMFEARSAPRLDLPARKTLALVIVWSAREPHRVGEVALLPAEERRWTLGRNPHSQGSRVHLRPQGRPVGFFRQRPPGASDRSQLTDSSALLAGEGISRQQIELTAGPEALHVNNIGRSPLHVNGVSVSEALVRPRDTLYLPDQIMFYCCWRPLELPPLRAYGRERAPYFGEPDQDGIIGESPAIWALRERLAISASMQRPIVINGDCRVTRTQAEQALSAMVAQSRVNPPGQGSQAAPALLAPVNHFGVAVTEPGFQEVTVPRLNERPEDIPFILYHLLRERLFDDDADLSPYFWMGLPRVTPSMIATLLHQFYSRDVAQLTEIVQRVLDRPASRNGASAWKGPKAAPGDVPRPTHAANLRAPARPATLLRRRRHPTPGEGSGSLSTPAHPIEQTTLAMLLREGLQIPNDWSAPRKRIRGRSRDSG